MKVGNYSFNIEGRYDFHKWLWMVSSRNRPEQTTDCALISAVARPVAKAYDWDGHAQVINGRWSMTVDVPDGLRCGDIYYGPVIPTTTCTAGTRSRWPTLNRPRRRLRQRPGGTITHPFTLTIY